MCKCVFIEYKYIYKYIISIWKSGINKLYIHIPMGYDIYYRHGLERRWKLDKYI